MNDYKVCILAAGVGSRMGVLSDHVNKAILPVNFKAAISHIIEKFPVNIEIVIAIGHKKETVIDYLAIAHPNRRFTFVEVDKYTGLGTGPGYSLLQCGDALRCPFIFFSTDTIVKEEIPPPDKNWFGVAPITNPERFCTVKVRDNLIYQIDDKVKTDNRLAFIGLAGVYDYERFFSKLAETKALIAGEIQVSNGFKHLIEKKLISKEFTWFDTGTPESYIGTSRKFSGEEARFDFSKGNEFLYFVDDRVIKYFADPEVVRKRCERAELLKGICPAIKAKRNNFYAYKKIDGEILYNVLEMQLVDTFLNWAKTNLWRRHQLDEDGYKQFQEACRAFYYDKTMKRLQQFYEKTGIIDDEDRINENTVPSAKELFANIDWDCISAGIPATIHGDLQFDNVIVANDKGKRSTRFWLVDWRQDFGGLTDVGDLYYDLAKLYGGMVLSYQLIKKGMFSFNMSGRNISYGYHTDNLLAEAREVYEKFIENNGFDLRKIKIMCGLIFLNMAPLHNYPFDHLLFFLGKSTIHNMVSKKCLQQN